MRDGPVIDLSQVVLVNKFGESLAPIVPYGFGGGGSAGDEFGEVGEEIVAAAAFELGGEGGGPVGSVGFEGVGEDGVGWGWSEGFDEGVADSFEVGGNGFLAKGIQDPAFGTYGGSLDDLAGVAGDKEQDGAGGRGGGDGGVEGGVEDLGGGGVPVFGLTVYERGRDDGLAFGQLHFG